jgi:hypothetical protein
VKECEMQIILMLIQERLSRSSVLCTFSFQRLVEGYVTIALEEYQLSDRCFRASRSHARHHKILSQPKRPQSTNLKSKFKPNTGERTTRRPGTKIK